VGIFNHLFKWELFNHSKKLLLLTHSYKWELLNHSQKCQLVTHSYKWELLNHSKKWLLLTHSYKWELLNHSKKWQLLTYGYKWESLNHSQKWQLLTHSCKRELLNTTFEISEVCIVIYLSQLVQKTNCDALHYVHWLRRQPNSAKHRYTFTRQHGVTYHDTSVFARTAVTACVASFSHSVSGHYATRDLFPSCDELTLHNWKQCVSLCFVRSK
jgi:hypothetical protein